MKTPLVSEVVCGSNDRCSPSKNIYRRMASRMAHSSHALLPDGSLVEQVATIEEKFVDGVDRNVQYCSICQYPAKRVKRTCPRFCARTRDPCGFASTDARTPVQSICLDRPFTVEDTAKVFCVMQCFYWYFWYVRFWSHRWD